MADGAPSVPRNLGNIPAGDLSWAYLSVYCATSWTRHRESHGGRCLLAQQTSWSAWLEGVFQGSNMALRGFWSDHCRNFAV
jgi:hypothetical protein